MCDSNIKEKAFNKVWSNFQHSILLTEILNPYWKLDEETGKTYAESDKDEVKIWNYILTLIEKDRCENT